MKKTAPKKQPAAADAEAVAGKQRRIQARADAIEKSQPKKSEK